ncbi:type II CAAX endopeptidase family protein [Hyphobacterium sp. HN65]|uniref:Type II CAAX endopeptidase family protein n=1 Tax=Hyphobacterium lacteum TaxID=3116575 RepID=A0ABU7LQ29_9PROT|nr:type II CAAX endopeptidase family protein [Hyphobacterium sp. HN65]MEE2526025.1 type II CAAX endopeptidase family protein [Hyphobacterium sp. HN65]
MTEADRSFDLRILFAALIGVLGLLAWQVLGGGIAVALVGNSNPLLLYLFIKGVFAGFIILLAILFGRLEAVGFRRPAGLSSLVYGTPVIALSLLLASQMLQTGLVVSLAVAAGWALMALFVSIGEETVFRGLLYRLMAPLGYWATAIVTSSAFGAIHLLGLFSPLPDALIYAQCIFAASVGLVLFTVRTAGGSLWTVLFLHWFIDAAAFVSAGGVNPALANADEAIPRFLLGAAIMLAWGLPAAVIQKRRLSRRESHQSSGPDTAGAVVA